MQLPSEVPVMILHNAILFPQAILPLRIFEPRYRRMLADSLETHRMFSVAMQRPGCARETPCGVAGVGLIRASVCHPDGTSHLVLQGLVRVELAETVRYKPYRLQRIVPIKAKINDSVMIDALVLKVRELVQERISQGYSIAFPVFRHLAKSVNSGDMKKLASQTTERFQTRLRELEDPAQIADTVCCALLHDPLQRQIILETIDVERRLKHLVHFLLAEIEQA